MDLVWGRSFMMWRTDWGKEFIEKIIEVGLKVSDSPIKIIKINKKVTEVILAILFSKRNAAFNEFDNTKYIHPNMTITEICKILDIIEIYEFAITNKPINPIKPCV